MMNWVWFEKDKILVSRDDIAFVERNKDLNTDANDIIESETFIWFKSTGRGIPIHEPIEEVKRKILFDSGI